jgi:ABC-type polysaccharide/polyol phosphate export permease
MLKEILKYKDLLFMLTLRDIKIRYKQAVMGFLWAIFMPVIAIASGILIKAAISIMSGKPMDLADVASVAVKVLPWTFFASAVRFSVNSLVGNRDLITKIYFPREVFPFASVIACLFDFIIAAFSLSIILCFTHIGISIYIFWLPIIIIFLILFTTGLGLLLSSANLFFRDVKYIVEIILMFGVFFTPVFYEASTFHKWQNLLLLNPIGSILENINNVVVLHKMPNIYWLSYAGISSIIMFIVGLLIFHKSEHLFAENI